MDWLANLRICWLMWSMGQSPVDIVLNAVGGICTSKAEWNRLPSPLEVCRPRDRLAGAGYLQAPAALPIQ